MGEDLVRCMWGWDEADYGHGGGGGIGVLVGIDNPLPAARVIRVDFALRRAVLFVDEDVASDDKGGG